jgi:hypothetical protein
VERDFSDMLSELSAAGADFLVVGAYALSAHGCSRATQDIDIRVRPRRPNAERVMTALKKYGAPLFDLTVEDLCTPDIVFQIGRAPLRIDILTSIAGVDFDEAWNERQVVAVLGVELPVVSYRHLLQNKRATGRPKDATDALWLEEHPPE